MHLVMKGFEYQTEIVNVTVTLLSARYSTTASRRDYPALTEEVRNGITDQYERSIARRTAVVERE